MKLKFSIHYRTTWGQTMHVVISYLGNDGYKTVDNHKLQTKDGENWFLEICGRNSLQHPFYALVYRYQVEDSEGQIVRQEWDQMPRAYCYDPSYNYTFPDFWREAPLEYSFGDDAEELSPACQLADFIAPQRFPLFNRTILFRVTAAGLSEHESIGIIGSHPVLGHWHIEHYLNMVKVGDSDWMLSIHLYATDVVLEYKYVIIDNKQNVLKTWENGNNRTVDVLPETDGDVLVLYGGDIHLHQENRQYAKVSIITSQPRDLISWAESRGDQIKSFEWTEAPSKTPMQAPYKTYIFDLDGTLLYSLGDLAASCNVALRHHHMPERTLEEVRMFVGNGVEKLIERAVPKGTERPVVEQVLSTFRSHYLLHGMDTTKPYDGIMELLKELHEQGCHVAVVSNKFQIATEELCKSFFHPYVDIALGESPVTRRKPAPDMVLRAIQKLGVDKKDCVYIGDSDVDIATARNSGIPCISVLWGFRDRHFLEENGATTFVTTPSEILSCVVE